MKVGIVGSRGLVDRDWMWKVLDLQLSSVPVGQLTVVSGEAAGADTFAKEWAAARGHAYEGLPAEWRGENGKTNMNAGFDRNHDIVNTTDFGIAFWNGVSNGTRHTIKLYRQSEKPVVVHHFKQTRRKEDELTFE